jgi:PAS domain S-box-containing protein
MSARRPVTESSNSFVDELPHVVWTQDEHGAIDSANRHWFAYTGRALGDSLTILDLAPLMPPAEFECFLGESTRAIASGISYETDVRLKKIGSDDSTYRWHTVRTAPHRGAGGTVRWVGSATDIHERKRAEAELWSREELMGRVFENTDDCIKILDREGRLLSMNASGQRHIEIDDLEPWIGTLWTDFWHGTDRDAAKQAFDLALTGETNRFQGYFLSAKGRPMWWSVVVTPILGPDGSVEKILAFSHDVSDLRAMSSALSQSERSQQILADSLPAIVWSAQSDGSFDYFNERWAEYTGALIEESLGAGWTRFVHPDDVDESVTAWSIARATGGTYEQELRLRRGRDASYRWHIIRAVPVLSDSGEIVRWFGTTTDIEERKFAYEREREWSNSFQRASLPPSLPMLSGLTFDAVYEPGLSDAQVGGDWYDALRLADGRVLVSIGDVAGSGVHAAVVMGVVRQILRGIAQAEHPDVFVTAWVGVLDLVTRTLTYASAGHPYPLLIAPNVGVRELEHSALPLGLRKGHDGVANIVEIPDHATLVLYTDGLTESTHDIAAGNERLLEAARSLTDASVSFPAHAIARAVIPNGSHDDVAILVAQTDYALIESQIERWMFDAGDVSTATRARRAFCASLQARGIAADMLPNAELIFGELIGNAIRHAPGIVDIVVDYSTDQPVLHVLDRGVGFRHISRLPADPLSESGRGLFIISSVAEDFTVTLRPDGGSHARVIISTAYVGDIRDRVQAESSFA